jgi:hypothetical protein
MSSPGPPGLRLERPKARGTSIRQPVIEKICVVRGPRGQMEKNVFHRELLTSLGLATGKAKRAVKILFKGLLELLSLLEVRVMVQPNKVDFGVRKVLKRKKVSRD